MKIVKWIFAAALVLAVLSGCNIVVDANANRKPVVDLTASSIWITTGQVTILTATATDPEGDALTYEWFEDGSPIPGTDDTLLYWNAVELRDIFTVSVVVTDGAGKQGTDSVDLTVDPINFGSVLVVNQSGLVVDFFADRLNGVGALYSGDLLGVYEILPGESYLFYGYDTDWYDFKAGAGGGITWETIFDYPGGVYLEPRRVYQFILNP